MVIANRGSIESLALGRALGQEMYEGVKLIEQLKKYRSLISFIKLHPDKFSIRALEKYSFEVKLAKEKGNTVFHEIKLMIAKLESPKQGNSCVIDNPSKPMNSTMTEFTNDDDSEEGIETLQKGRTS